MASSTEICNIALQLVTSNPISSMAENSVEAQAVSVSYDHVRKTQLEANNWKFAAGGRAQLAAAAVQPAFGNRYAYPLPADFLHIYQRDPLDNTPNDWDIQTFNDVKCLITQDPPPVNIVYVQDITDPNIMTALFRDVFAKALAVQVCAVLTQSTEKTLKLEELYKKAMMVARNRNAINLAPVFTQEDSWVTTRNGPPTFIAFTRNPGNV